MTTGISISYIDSDERVTGRIPYILNMSLPGMLHAAVHRSPYAHARILSIDTSEAEAVPGVVAVLTRDDIVDNPDINPRFGPVVRDQPIVAIDKVHFVGDPVIAVAAVDEDTAEYAANLVEVEYEELPAMFEIAEALAPDAPTIHEATGLREQGFADIILHEITGNYCNHFVLQHGEPKSAMAEADYVFEDVFQTPASQHVPLEPHVAIAQVENRRVTVWSSTQTPYVVRAQLAEVFNLPQNRVRVIVQTLGGGYGAKTYPKIEPLTAALAQKAGAPVKLVLSRAEEFITICKHESIIKMRTGVRANGELVAKEVECWWNAGAYADISPRLIKNGGYTSNGPYRIPHVEVNSHAVYTNRPPAGAYRGYGVAQSAWAFESQMDMIADRLGMDPVELRSKNLLNPGDTFATGEVIDDIAFHELLDHTAEAIGWGENNLPLDLAKARGKGIAIILKSSITPSTSSAQLRINPDGSCAVLTSTVEMGQGSNTTLTQIAAEELGLAYDQVSIVQPDTDVTPFDLTTSSSRSTFSMGQALRMAAQDAKQQAITHAAKLLKVQPDALEVRDGGVYLSADPTEGGQGMSFAELIAKSRCGNILGSAVFTTEGGLDPETGQGVASVHWHHAAAAAEVEVDKETGAVDIVNFHAAIYTGKSINPVNVELQTEGNVVFGLGKALLEEMVFDNGQMVNANLADYMIPSFEDLPQNLTLSAHQNPDPQGEPHGIGETSLPPVAPAISNAIFNAIGVRIMGLPISPEKILNNLKNGPQKIQAPDEVHEWVEEPA